MLDLKRLFIVVVGVLGAASGRAFAQSEEVCAVADPTNVQDVFACMSSGGKYFQSIGNRDCPSLARRYAGARKDAIRRQEFPLGKPVTKAMDMGPGDFRAGPTCEVFAQALELYENKRPYWADCIGADGADPAQVKSCLTSFVPGYRGGRARVEDLKSCDEITREFQSAMRSATIDPAYEAPIASCQEIAAAFEQQQAQSPEWAKCFDYDANNLEAHVRQCVDLKQLELVALNGSRTFDCGVIRQEYEAGLQKAYGSLPPNYRGMPCDTVSGMVADFEARREEMARERARREAEAREAAAREAAARQSAPRPAYSGSGSGGSFFDFAGLLSGLAVGSAPSVFSDPVGWFSRMIGFSPSRIWTGFGVQLVITVAAWAFAWRQQQRGKWWVPKGVIFDKVFYARFKLVNAALILALIFFMGYGLWFAVGAIIAAIVTRFAEPIIADLGFFKTQEATSGIVEDPKTKIADAPAPKGADIQSQQDW